ncbi:hypothetical protein FHS82_002393 [Pseudochelatococcus lubricantis]|uniref:Rad50/SbcC-type AAA domain-containing protein n=1 Tax=Pseudochelatococcus lubricantis TaxID=1538102 RepID=A0ABX0V2U4_9HYPH|nr:AAA family ATPase [Pseudochelatococcus lubricantis]NIJ58545.1 hypothetical protein [Pseudochelatococcus lubricantis]
MRLTGIRVEGVGRFAAPVAVSGLGPGVNILAAGNEAGKSTLFRAVRACLFERHATSREDVAALASAGLSLPVRVALDFEHGGHGYRIEKSFLRSRSAQFFRDGVLVARDRAADEAVWDLIGIAPGNGRAGVDEAAFGLLWVGQRQSFVTPSPSEAAAAALNRAIHEEVGTLVGGERARQLLASLAADIDRLYTAQGRPKAGGPLAAAIQQRDALVSELAVVEARLADLDTHLTELAARLKERGELNDPALAAELAADLAQAQKAFADGEAAHALLTRLEVAEQKARLAFDAAENILADHLRRADRIDADRARLAELATERAPLDAQVQTANAGIAAVEADKAETDTRIRREEAQERALQRLAAVRAQAAGLDALKRRRADLAALKTRIVDNDIALEANRATAQAVAELDRLQREIAVSDARLAAAAAQVSLVLGPSGAGRVRLDGEILHGDVAQAAVRPLAIAIDGIATITVTPPPTDAATVKARGQHEAALSTLLKAAGHGSPEDLRTGRAERETLEMEATALKAELRSFGIAADALTKNIADLDVDVARIVSLQDSLSAGDGVPPDLPDADIAARLAAIRTGREEARQRRQTLDARLAAHNGTLAALAARRGEIAGSLAEIDTRLAADLARLPDDTRAARHAALDAALAQARETLQTQAAAFEGQRRQAPPADELDRLRLRIRRLEDARNNRRAKLEQLERIIAGLEGQILNAGGDGLGERAEALRADLQLAGQEVERVERRGASLRLLRETVEDCYRQHRDRLTAPLRRHLAPYLNDVFPAAEVTLGDGFGIEGIRRGAPDAERFESLSDGTQEQIAVLVRLAMGSLLAERGFEVPVILDDALVYSDDGRIARMFDALSRAGEKQQVIVLTCRTRAFAALGGRPLAITDV